MAGTKTDLRQTVLRPAQAMIGSAANDTTDTILPKINDELAKLFEDRNIELVDGGVVTVNSTATTVAFTSSLKLHVNSRVAGGSPVIIDLAATTRTLSADGRMLYAVINRSAGTATVTDDSATLPAVTSANQEVFLIAKRVGTTIYFRNGFSISANQSSALAGQSSEYLQSTITTDSASTGSAITITAPTGGVVRLTNASLVSVSGIPSTAFGKLLILENKTGASLSINNEDTGTTAANRILTGVSSSITIGTDAAISLVYDTTSARWTVIGGTGSGSGGGVTNLVTNGNADNASASIFTTYADAAGTRPVDGTGGSPTVTTSVTSTLPLTGTKSFLLTKPASNTQGQGWSVPVPVDLSYRAKVLQISCDYIVNTGTFAAGTSSTDSDVIVYLYDVTNSLLIEPSSIKLLSNSTSLSDKFQSTFQTSATGSSYRLIFHCATTSAVAYELKVDNVTVSPSTYVYGTPITDWLAYTPNVSGLGTVSNEGCYWRRVGDSVEIKGSILSGTATGSSLSISIPSGLSIDASKNPSTTDTASHGLAYNTSAAASYSGTGAGPFIVHSDTATASNLLYIAVTNSGGRFAKVVGTTIGSSSRIRFEAKDVPILGWSSSVQMSDQTDTRVVAAGATITTGASTPASTQLDFSTVFYDTHSAITTGVGAWKFTAPISGYYRVSGSFQTSGNPNIRLFKNGSAVQYLASESTALITPYSGSIFLNTGDFVDLRLDSTQTPASGTAGTYSSTVFIERISGPSAIAASEEVSCVYTNSAGTSIPNTGDNVVAFATKEYDSHNAYNTSTGVFTCPTSGRYEVAATFNFAAALYAASNAQNASVFKNSVVNKYGFVQTAMVAITYQAGLSVTAIINCIAGDTLSAAIFNGRTAGATSLSASGSANHLSIKRLK